MFLSVVQRFEKMVSTHSSGRLRVKSGAVGDDDGEERA